MARDYSICVATIGHGVWQSPDGGENWKKIWKPFPLENDARALTVYPNNPHRILAGTNGGIFRSEDHGANWDKLYSPMDGMNIWSIAIDPVDPNIIFAGASPPGVFRSRDGGQRWDKLSVGIAKECYISIPRVTAIVVDPQNHRTVWVGVEVDGVYKSQDGGDIWSRVDAMTEPDIHGMLISPGPPKTILVSTPFEIYTSTDEGESWESLPVKMDHPLDHVRGIALKEDDPKVVFAGGGDQSPGSTGGIPRSKDGGKTWEMRPLPVEPNSHIWCLATHPSDPDLVLASSALGQVYVSSDAGDSWTKLKREFSDIKGLAWMPN